MVVRGLSCAAMTWAFSSVPPASGRAMPCVAFCNEDGKRLDLPVNWLATGMWHDALVRKGSRFGVLAEGGGYEDYLVGVIVVISGNSRLMDELFIRLP